MRLTTGLAPLVRYLDPRSEGDAERTPYADAVAIPLSEVADRMHELPPRRSRVEVIDCGDAADRMVEFLRASGREAVKLEGARVSEYRLGRLWEPNAFLMEVSAALQPGSAVDFACGSGRDAVALAAAGWQVLAMDHLPEALAKGRDLAGRYLKESLASRIEWRAMDLESETVELGGPYDLAYAFWYLNRPLVRRIHESISPGGNFVMETFTNVHREVYGKPRNEAFVLQPGELAELTDHLELVRYEEGWHEDRHSARVWARAR